MMLELKLRASVVDMTLTLDSPWGSSIWPIDQSMKILFRAFFLGFDLKITE